MGTRATGIGGIAGREIEGVTTAASAARAAALKARVVGIDVEAKPTIARIIRGGEEIAPPVLNESRVEDLVGRLVPITRLRVPRCVSQSIPAGTLVAPGTPIDLVVVPVGDVDFGLFDRVHEEFKMRSIESMLPVIADPAIDPILKKAAFADLSDTEKTTLRTRLGTEGINVDDADPTRSTDIAFQTMKSAKAFQ